MSATSDAWPIWDPTLDGTPLDAIISHAALHGIYRIADTAERATLLAALVANGQDDTIVYTHRLDATAGKNLEFTMDGGANWYALDGRDSGVTAISTFGTGCTADATQVPNARVRAGRVELEGRINISPSIPVSTSLQICTLDAAFRPPSGVTRVFPLVAQNDNRFGRITVSSTGAVTAEVNPTGTVSNVYLDNVSFRAA